MNQNWFKSKIGRISSSRREISLTLDQLDSLFRRIPKRNVGLKARIGNEIVWTYYRSGNLGMGAAKGEDLFGEESAGASPKALAQSLWQSS